MREINQNFGASVMVLMVESGDHITGATGLALSVEISKDGGAFSPISPSITERGHGWYSIALTSEDTDTPGDLALHIEADGADPADVLLYVSQMRMSVYAALSLAEAIDVSTSTLPGDIAAVKSQTDKLQFAGTDVKATLDGEPVKLASDGLDDVSTAAPSGVASNFREMMVQLWRRWFARTTLTGSQLKTYADDGSTVLTTQAISEDETTQEVGAAT